MKLAVLPFNAAPGTSPALARQLANLAGETVKNATSGDINFVNYVAQVETPNGPRGAFVNMSEDLLEADWIARFFEQVEADRVMDGLLDHTHGSNKFELTVRFHDADGTEPLEEFKFEFEKSQIFASMHFLVKQIAKHAAVELPESLAGDTMEFGTEDADALLSFAEGYDALMYLQQTNGQVPQEFDPEPAVASLMKAYMADKDFSGAYDTLIQLCRACANYRVGRFEVIEKALTILAESEPEDYRPLYALAEANHAAGRVDAAKDLIERAIDLEPNEPALHARLGLLQEMLGMPNNAERSFRKALELEGDDKPTTDLLANVLLRTNRAHEVPYLWNELMERFPENPVYAAKYAMALVAAQEHSKAIAAFEAALELPDNLFVKRAYAPLLVQEKDFDRALDFYEECLEVAGGDVALLFEYAQALQAADREVDIPGVLRQILNSTHDPNARAQAQAWLLEIEQRSRTAVVGRAQQKLEENDAAGAIKDLKPLRNWLSDYWKLWALLASAHNRVGEPAEAEFAAKKLIELFPGNEIGYVELTNALGSLRRHEEAYQWMRHAVSTIPPTVPLMLSYGLAARRFNQDDEAENVARQIRQVVGEQEGLEPILAEIEGRPVTQPS